jgi:hypothetical protein
MAMTEYFPTLPLGEGTVEIEAFGSLFCRMAIAHSVSIYALTTHLREWWKHKVPGDERAKRNVTNSMNPMLCGIGPNVATYVNIVEDATGCRTLNRTTLLSLRSAISLSGHQLVRKGRAWCPACMDESKKGDHPFYDRLLWAVEVIKRCPVHKIALESNCPHCGRLQAHYHHLGQMLLCYVCKKPILSPSSTWKVVLNPPLYEKECLNLVNEISTGRIMCVAEDAYGIFINEFADYLSPLGLKISRQAYRTCRRPQRAREATRPRFATLLRRCAAFGIEPSDLFRDPIEAAKSACLLEFARLDLPHDLKPRRSVDLVRLSWDRLHSKLAEAEYSQLPSLAGIARDLGVSKGFLNYHHRDLCSKYAHHRTRCRNRKVVGEIESAVAYLRDGPITQYPSANFPSHDHLVAAVVRELEIAVRVARIAVGVALKKRLGQRAYQRYRKANSLDIANPVECPPGSPVSST